MAQKTYRTVQGDMWDSIAYKMMGDCKFTDILITENQKYIKTYIFEAGAELVIPEVPDEYALPLPPWKRKST